MIQIYLSYWTGVLYMNTKILVLVILLVFLFIFTSTTTHTTTTECKNTTKTQMKEVFSSVNFGNTPIAITSNAQLAAQATSGDGSSDNPYILENYSISNCGPNINGVSIENTNKYFILRNISVSHCQNGFFFLHVTHGSIDNSFAANNVSGFVLSSSSYNSLTENTAINEGYGFRLVNSSNNVLNGNIVTNSAYGFRLEYLSSHNVLTKNIATDNNEGFLLSYSSYNSLTDNAATNNKFTGFDLEYSSINALTRNTATNNNNGGFLLYFSSYNALTQNAATNNNYSGFDLGHASDNALTGNIAEKNAYNGFLLEISSTKNILRYNIGIENHLYDYIADHSPNNILFYNRFITAYFSPVEPFNPLAFSGALGIILVIIVLIVELRIALPSTDRLSVSKKQQHLNTNDKISGLVSDNDAATAIILVETILEESYHAPDYETAVKIQQGGFPDYATFKQALDKGITTYVEWLNYQKKQ